MVLKGLNMVNTSKINSNTVIRTAILNKVYSNLDNSNKSNSNTVNSKTGILKKVKKQNKQEINVNCLTVINKYKTIF